MLANSNPNLCYYSSYSAQSGYLDDVPGIIAKFKILIDGYRKIFDQLCSKSKELGDMLRFLPGVVVQKRLNMQGMADLYRIKPELLERLVKFTMEPLKPSPSIYISVWFLYVILT